MRTTAEYVRQALHKARHSDDPAKLALDAFHMAGPAYYGLMESAWTMELVTRNAHTGSKHMPRFGALLLHIDALMEGLRRLPLRYWATVARTPAERHAGHVQQEPMTEEAVRGIVACLQLFTKALSRLDQVGALQARLFYQVDDSLQRLLYPKTKSDVARNKWNAKLRNGTTFHALNATLETLVNVGMYSDQLLQVYADVFRVAEGEFQSDTFHDLSLDELTRFLRTMCIARYWNEHDLERDRLKEEDTNKFWRTAIAAVMERLLRNDHHQQQQQIAMGEHVDENTAYESIQTKVWSRTMEVTPWSKDGLLEEDTDEEPNELVSDGTIATTWEDYYRERRMLSTSSIDESLEQREQTIQEEVKNGSISNTRLIFPDDALSTIASSNPTDVVKIALARLNVVRLSLKYVSTLREMPWKRLEDTRLTKSCARAYQTLSPRKLTAYQKNVLLKSLENGDFLSPACEADVVSGIRSALVWPLEKVVLEVDTIHRSHKSISLGANVSWISDRSGAKQEQQRQKWMQQQPKETLQGMNPIAILGTGRAKFSTEQQRKLVAAQNDSTSDTQEKGIEIRPTSVLPISMDNAKENYSESSLIRQLMPPTLKVAQDSNGLESAEVSYYRDRTRVPLPPTRLKQLIFERTGWTTVSLPFESWQSISSKRRIAYLQMLLPSSVRKNRNL